MTEYKTFRCSIGDDWSQTFTARTWQEAAEAAARRADGDLDFMDGDTAVMEVYDGTTTILAEVVVHDVRTYDVEFSRTVGPEESVPF
jgi:hypothetical protein